MSHLSDPKVTHIGVGFAEDSTKVLVVELLSHNPIAVTSLQPAEDGSIICEGINMDTAGAGLYAARIVSSTQEKKVASLIGPQNITFDKNTGRFKIHFEPPAEEVFYAQDPKYLEIFIRRRQVD